MVKKKIYTIEFKKEVVRLSLKSKSIKDLSDAINVCVDDIYKWRKSFIHEVTMNSQAESSVLEVDRYKEIQIKGHASLKVI